MKTTNMEESIQPVTGVALTGRLYNMPEGVMPPGALAM